MPNTSNRRSLSRLRLYIDLGDYGTDEIEDSQSAIARPWRRLFQDGVDPGRICYVVTNPSATMPRRIVGAFCETNGGRLLFFPGCQGRQLNARFSRASNTSVPLTGMVDHLTFEIDRHSAHITEVQPNGNRQVALRLSPRVEVDVRLYAWFGITLRSLNSLEIVPGKLWFSAQSPTSDVQRRRQLFRQAGQNFRISSLDTPEFQPRSFVQINVFVDFEPERIRSTIRSFLLVGPPELRTAINMAGTIPAQLQGLQLYGDDVAIKMHVMVSNGAPSSDVAFGF